MSEQPEPCCFDEWAGDYARRARSRKLGGVSRDLLVGLARAGLDERTVLDVGCGAGGLVFEALERGAVGATGVDLSQAAITQARGISSERRLTARATFEVADGATAALARHDIVVLDKVFCCYPDVDGLLGNSLAAAGSVYAFSVPPSVGIRGAIRRSLTRVANLWYRLRRRRFGRFQAFVHNVETLDSRVRAEGFERRFFRRRLAWDIAVYARA